MGNKEIQRQRMMTYFIDAAKEIIKEEGVKGITARKIGEKAGYSYATIYNYFGDINSLLMYCAFEFLEDCHKYMLSFKDNEVDCREQIIIYSSAYFRFFAENPNMFQLTFLENLGKIPEDLLNRAMQPSVALLLNENIIECAKKGYITEENIKILQNLIGYSLHGKLIFFMNARNTEKLDDMLLSVKEEIEFLLG